jgi:hypothetical protein
MHSPKLGAGDEGLEHRVRVAGPQLLQHAVHLRHGDAPVEELAVPAQLPQLASAKQESRRQWVIKHVHPYAPVPKDGGSGEKWHGDGEYVQRTCSREMVKMSSVSEVPSAL